MNDILQTITEYKHSCRQLIQRIHRLNEQIGGRAASGHTPSHILMRRRKLLYTELAEMQEAIREMEEYTDQRAKTKAASFPQKTA